MSDLELATELAKEYGFEDPIDLGYAYMHQGCIPGICTKCRASYEYEADCDRGWCEECESNTVKSVFILLHII